jgi:signal peptidase I
MSPVVLLAILSILAVARIILWVAPAVAPNEKARGILREYLDAFIIAGAVALVLMHYVVRTFWIPSGSMLPTLDIHDVLLADEIQYRFENPKDGQIAVFEPPPQLGTTDFIKRVMAAPGDTFRIHNGTVFRNGRLLSEPYIPNSQRPDYELQIKDYQIIVDGVPLDSSRAIVPPRSQWQAPDKVPNGYYLMLGDNRNDSDDGHLWGFLPRDHFVGHAFFVFWPITHIKALR